MENKISFLKKIIRKKYFWIILIIVLSISGYLFLKPNSSIKNIVTEKAELTNLKQTVLATGQVISNTDLNLSFNISGVVKSIKVKVGDKVRKGQVLATLNQAQALADLTSARGGLEAAKARLEKTIEGSSSQEITLAELAVTNAKQNYENTKSQQNTLVQNAYHNLLNSTPVAIPSGGNSDYVAPTISGNYKLNKEGTININTYYTGSGSSFSASGLTVGNGIITTTTSQPIGNSGLYITFPSATNLSVNNWIIEIPNKNAQNYLTNYNTYQLALKIQQSALTKASALVKQTQAELAIKTASARDSDIKLAQANILSAKGQYQRAQAVYNNTRIIAPANGTITSVDTKLGELAPALKEVIILQSISNIYIDSNINEANIIGLVIGMPVNITFDAFGPDKIFQGKIISIDPSSTLISGVVNYTIKVDVGKIKNLRPGMTANLTIKVREKDEVVAVPSRSILVNENGSKYIRLITNSKNKKYKKVLVTTGLEGDNGLVEITKGLSLGQEFVVFIKS